MELTQEEYDNLKYASMHECVWVTERNRTTLTNLVRMRYMTTNDSKEYYYITFLGKIALKNCLTFY